jgi:hypothetical protein
MTGRPPPDPRDTRGRYAYPVHPPDDRYRYPDVDEPRWDYAAPPRRNPQPAPPGTGRRHGRAAPRKRSRGGPVAVVVIVLVVSVALIGFGVWRTVWSGKPVASGAPDRSTRPAAVGGPVSSSAAPLTSSAAPPPSSAAPPAAAPVQRGAGTFTYNDTTGPILGRGGTLRRFRLAVENSTGQDPVAFAAAVDTYLGDARSWIASGQVRFQRVPHSASAEFTIYLTSQFTSEKMCAAGGLHTQQFASCRLTAQVIINLTRWQTAIPTYGAPLDAYRAYAINHEVGHQLGHGHESCPGPGKPAPVMQQQTFGLKGCVANAWPYVNGQRYSGRPIP